MTYFYARTRRNRGAWLDTLLVNHSDTAGADLEELRDFAEALRTEGRPHALIALDSPAPARGYALVFQSDAPFEYLMLARIHVLDKHQEAAYRALFSEIIVQARRLRTGIGQPGDELAILVDPTALAPHVRDAITRYGREYNLTIGSLFSEGHSEAGEDSSKQISESTEITEITEIVSTLTKGEPVVITGEGLSGVVEEETEAAKAANGDLEENREFFEERGVPLEDEREEADEPEYDFLAMKKAELIDAAKALGVDTSGTVNELRQRLLAHSSEES